MTVEQFLTDKIITYPGRKYGINSYYTILILSYNKQDDYYTYTYDGGELFVLSKILYNDIKKYKDLNILLFNDLINLYPEYLI